MVPRHWVPATSNSQKHHLKTTASLPSRAANHTARNLQKGVLPVLHRSSDLGWAAPTGMKMVQSEVASRALRGAPGLPACFLMMDSGEECRRGLQPQPRALWVKLRRAHPLANSLSSPEHPSSRLPNSGMKRTDFLHGHSGVPMRWEPAAQV